MEIRLLDLTLSVDDTHSDFWRLLQAGKWEATTLNVFDRYIDAETVFVDVGAWIGPTTLYASIKAKRVISVEADPVAVSFLEKNVSRNPGLSSRIEILHRAILPSAGTLKLGSRGTRGDSMSSTLFQNSVDAWEIDCVTPEEIIRKIGAEEKLFVKMDIEGGEYLLGSSLLHFAQHPNVVLLIAFHPGFLPGTKLKKFLHSLLMTRKISRQFRDFDILQVSEKHARKPIFINFLHRLGLCYFRANDTFLFMKRN